MGRRGDAYDNALAESFLSTIDRQLLVDPTAARWSSA